MSIPSHFKSTTGQPDANGTLIVPLADADANLTMGLGESFTAIAFAESNSQVEYVEFFDNGGFLIRLTLSLTKTVHTIEVEESSLMMNFIWQTGMQVNLENISCMHDLLTLKETPGYRNQVT